MRYFHLIKNTYKPQLYSNNYGPTLIKQMKQYRKSAVPFTSRSHSSSFQAIFWAPFHDTVPLKAFCFSSTVCHISLCILGFCFNSLGKEERVLSVDRTYKSKIEINLTKFWAILKVFPPPFLCVNTKQSFSLFSCFVFVFLEGEKTVHFFSSNHGLYLQDFFQQCY